MPGFELSSSEAFDRSLNKVKERRQGYLEVSKIYTSVEVLSESYESFSGVSLIQRWLGYSFYWQKQRNRPIELFGESADVGLCHICKLKAPDSWVGCGVWEMRPPEEKYDPDDIDDSSELIIGIYLYSDEPKDLDDLIKEKDDCVFLAGMCLKGYEIQAFLNLSEKKFKSLK